METGLEEKRIRVDSQHEFGVRKEKEVSRQGGKQRYLAKESSKQKTKIQYRPAKAYRTKDPTHAPPNDTLFMSVRPSIGLNQRFKLSLLQLSRGSRPGRH
jgi:hypothetical protein